MTGRSLPLLGADPRLDEAARRELEEYAEQEAKALGVTEGLDQWFEPMAKPAFKSDQRSRTTIWVSGLTFSQDIFMAAALSGVGYDVRQLPTPDNDALRLGKEFGNRGQCNPTYYTVGNLVKHVRKLESDGLSRERILDEHLFLTVGACGPCRFGTYVTEYRKALRDAGYEGFRVLLMQQEGTVKAASGSDEGLVFNAAPSRARCSRRSSPATCSISWATGFAPTSSTRARRRHDRGVPEDRRRRLQESPLDPQGALGVPRLARARSRSTACGPSRRSASSASSGP